MEEKITFHNSKGDDLKGILLNPTGDTSRLIVIICHGLGSDKNSSSYLKLKDLLAEKNISTFRFDIWGHGESAGDFADVTVTEAVDDIVQAFNYLKEAGYTKIGLIGSSFGGLSSIVAAEYLPDLKFLVLKSPVSNWRENIWSVDIKNIDGWKKMGFRIYSNKDGKELKLNYSFYENAIKYNGYEIAPKITLPVCIIHGDKDTTVPIAQSQKISQLFPNCTLKIIVGADHRYTEHKQEMTAEMVDFITAYSAF